jgi:hypothetical protein
MTGKTILQGNGQDISGDNYCQAGDIKRLPEENPYFQS